MENIINNYIDCCINSNGAHYDISLVINEILKNDFRYIGNNIWEYKNENNEWVIDDKNKRLKYDIKTKAVNYFLERAKYWSDQSNKDEDKNIKFDCKLKELRILQITNKINDAKFLLLVIKEIKQFYNI